VPGNSTDFGKKGKKRGAEEYFAPLAGIFNAQQQPTASVPSTRR